MGNKEIEDIFWKKGLSLIYQNEVSTAWSHGEHGSWLYAKKANVHVVMKRGGLRNTMIMT